MGKQYLQSNLYQNSDDNMYSFTTHFLLLLPTTVTTMHTTHYYPHTLKLIIFKITATNIVTAKRKEKEIAPLLDMSKQLA